MAPDIQMPFLKLAATAARAHNWYIFNVNVAEKL